jgi:hypothetical protein
MKKKTLVMALAFYLLLCSVCLAIDTVNEKTTFTLQISFYDANGTLTIPTSFKYKLIDVVSGTILTDTTTISPGTATYDLIILSDNNRMLDTTKSFERRRLTVQWYSYATLIGTDQYIYQVKNLNEVPFP